MEFFPRPKLSIGENFCRIDFLELSTDAKSQTTHLHFDLKYLFPCMMICIGSDFLIFFDCAPLISSSRVLSTVVCADFSRCVVHRILRLSYETFLSLDFFLAQFLKEKSVLQCPQGVKISSDDVECFPMAKCVHAFCRRFFDDFHTETQRSIS